MSFLERFPQTLVTLQVRLHGWLAGKPGGRGVFRLLVAAALGVAAAYGSIFFRALIDGVAQIVYPAGTTLAELRVTPWYWLMLAPAIGGLFVGPLISSFAPEAKGHGVPEVKDACNNGGGRIRKRVALVKTLASAVCLGTGGSVGREGPIVQIGAAVGSGLGRLCGIRGQHLIDFVAAGAAAGIAATFNAPIAGVMFAIEVILGRSSPRHFSPLIVAAVVATVVTHHHLGANPAFAVPAYSLVSGWELLLYVLLGGCAGVVGVAFTRGLYLIEDLWERFPLPSDLRPAFGGAVVGALAIVSPEVLGLGYELIEGVLGAAPQDLTTLAVAGGLLWLIVMKILATSTTIGSGGSGGVFAPSLFLGASLGGAFGGFAQRWMPVGMVAHPSAYALVGMGAVVSATTHAPLTAILIVFELCDHHSIILPLMFASILATALAMTLCRESIYTLKLQRRGVRSEATDSPVHAVRATQVVELMQPSPPNVRPNASLELLVERAHEAAAHFVYVTDHKRQLLGVVSMDDVASHVHDSPAQRRPLRARDLMHPAVAVGPETTLDSCLELLQNRRHEQLPVIRNARLVGHITRADLLGYYSREVLRRDAVLSLVDSDQESPSQEAIALETGEVKAEIGVASAWVGRTLRELDFRTRFGVNVYAVRDGEGVVHLPDPGAPLDSEAALVVIGPETEVEHLRALAHSTDA